MKVGIHEMERGLLSEWSKKYISILEHNNIDYKILSINDLGFWEEIRTCSHFIYHWGGTSDAHQKAHALMPVVENLINIPCFPDWRLSWHYDDKIKGFFLMKALNAPVIDSFVFFERLKANEWLQNKAKYPLVFKLTRGAGSMDVVLVKNKKDALQIANKIFTSGILAGKIPGNDLWIKQFSFKKFLDRKARALYRKLRGLDANRDFALHKNYVFFQKFLPDNHFDTRVTTIGKRAFGFRRFNRKNDFRASGSGKIDHRREYIDERCIKIAFEVSKKAGFSCMTYDFLFDLHGKPKIAEISYTFNDLAVKSCSGFWDEELNWHEGHHWPEYLQLVDFLALSDLKCPDFES